MVFPVVLVVALPDLSSFTLILSGSAVAIVSITVHAEAEDTQGLW
jgi:hypothetical protein